MKLKIILAVVAALSVSAPAFCENRAWSEMNDSVVRMYQDGRYAQALPVAEKALKEARKNFPVDAPELALSLNNLALLYKNEGRYEESAKLYEESVSVAEKIAGPDAEDLIVPLNNLAMLYETQGQKGKADAIYERLRKAGYKEEAAAIEKRGDQAGRD
jgi:tetratricopeptide (TPR) repeat protein